MSAGVEESTDVSGLPIEKVQEALLAWYRANRRDLPWRRTHDPYKIWVSEVMLQQTQVDTVLDYYKRFLERFPTLGELAAADLDEVLDMWAGLGYYSRARSLHAAVREVVELYRGQVPRDPDEFGALPGVGPYTRGAVLSIAYGLPIPAVDGNVMRVVSRLAAIEEPVDRAAGRRQVEAIAASLLEQTAPGDWNQAVMELGALICRPTAPRCSACPVASFCHARKAGIEATLPRSSATVRVRRVERLVAGVVVGDALVLVKRPDNGLLAGMWDLISLEGDPGSWLLPGEREAALQAHLEALGFADATWRAYCGRTNHRLSHVWWEMWVYLFEATCLPTGEYEAVSVDTAAQIATATGVKKAIKLVLDVLGG